MTVSRTEKPCAVCGVVKPLADFHRHVKMPDGHRYRCKTCTQVDTKKRSADPVYREYQRQWRKSNPEKVKAKARRADLKRLYGLSESQFAEMLAEQGGACAACRTTNPGTSRRYFDTDHDHATGIVRGLLCHPCNKALGFVRDSPTRLQALIDYLQRGPREPGSPG